MIGDDAYEGVVILGFPRSGTTLLRRLLNAHPRLCCPPETSVLKACARFLDEQPMVGGLKLGVRAGLAYSGIEPDDLVARLRELAFGLFRDICRRQGKSRWVEKSPFDIFDIETVERLCADRCRYVCLVRHPLDVVCSTKELCDQIEIFPFELHDYVCRHRAPLEAFAEAWADTHRSLLAFERRNAARCHRLRYEDLVADPAAEMDRLLQWLGEPTDAAALVSAAMQRRDEPGLGDWKTYEKREITTESTGRWQALSPHTVAALLAFVGPLMGDFGYEPVTVAVSDDDRRARRQHQISMAVSRLKAEVGSR